MVAAAVLMQFTFLSVSQATISVVNRHGPRLPVLACALKTALCLHGFALQSTMWLLWSLHLVVGLIGWTLFGPLVANTAVNKWFVHRCGWALAVGSTGI